MNDSTSTISPVWPTSWPKDSFRPWPTALVFGAILAAFIVVLLLGVGWLAVCCRPALFARDMNVLLMPSLVFQGFGDLAVAAVVITQLPQLSGFPPRAIGLAVPNSSQVLTAVLGAVVMTIVVQSSSAVIEKLAHTTHQEEAVALFRSLHNPTQIAIFIFFATIVAPIGEEALFRLFAFNAFLRYTSGFWPAAIASGILFGALHTDVYAFLPLALAGIVLAGVYYRTRNAFTSMITHGLFNAVPLVLLAFFPKLAN